MERIYVLVTSTGKRCFGGQHGQSAPLAAVQLLCEDLHGDSTNASLFSTERSSRAGPRLRWKRVRGAQRRENYRHLVLTAGRKRRERGNRSWRDSRQQGSLGWGQSHKGAIGHQGPKQSGAKQGCPRAAHALHLWTRRRLPPSGHFTALCRSPELGQQHPEPVCSPRSQTRCLQSEESHGSGQGNKPKCEKHMLR